MKRVLFVAISVLFFIGAVDAVGEVSVVSLIQWKSYNFSTQQNISAYHCRIISGFLPLKLPGSLKDCNTELFSITNDPGLDFNDFDYVDEIGWSRRSLHHIFLIDAPNNKSQLKKFSVNYVARNPTQNPYFVHLYIRNFQTGQWELLDSKNAPPHSDRQLNYTSPFGNQTKYFSSDGKVWFLTTDGKATYGSINSDYFSVDLGFPVELVLSNVTLNATSFRNFSFS